MIHSLSGLHPRLPIIFSSSHLFIEELHFIIPQSYLIYLKIPLSSFSIKKNCNLVNIFYNIINVYMTLMYTYCNLPLLDWPLYQCLKLPLLSLIYSSDAYVFLNVFCTHFFLLI